MKTKYIGINENIESYGDEKWYEYDGEELSTYIETLSEEQTEIFLRRMNDNDENIFIELAHPTDNMSTYYRIVAGWKNDTDMSDEDYANNNIDLILITINDSIKNIMQTFYNKNENKFEELNNDGNSEYDILSVLCEVSKDDKVWRFDLDYGVDFNTTNTLKDELELEDEEYSNLSDIIEVLGEGAYLEHNGYVFTTGDVTYYNNNENEQKRIKYEEII